MLRFKYGKEDTQTVKILRHLKRYGAIMSIEAFELYYATRLSGIIYRLREEGFDIETRRVIHKRTSYGKYVLPKNDTNLKMFYKYRRLL